MESEPFPPGPRGGAQRADDNRATRCFFVELDGGGKDVGRERGPDPEVGVAAVDRQPSEKERRDRIRRTLRERFRRGRSVDSSHRDTRVRDDDIVQISDHPRRGRVAPAVLPRVAAKPVVEDGFVAVELFAVMAPWVQRRRAAKLSQPS
jgi:hypothetical protein